MACLAFPNLPLLAAFRRGSERRSIAGQEVHCPVGLAFDRDLKRWVAVNLAHFLAGTGSDDCRESKTLNAKSPVAGRADRSLSCSVLRDQPIR